MSTADRTSGARSARSPATIVEQTVFYVLLALLAARPMIGEVFERVEISFVASMEDAGGPGPVNTAWLDALLLLATGAAFMLRPSLWGRPVVAGGVIALVLGVAFSLLSASNSHVAVFAGASLVISVLGAVGLALLCTTRWRRRLIVAALLATGLTTAVKCINQHLYEFPETVKYWEQTEKPRLIKLGYDADDPLFINYERRLAAREPHGFLNHPNVTASVLTMCALVTAGLLIGVGVGSLRNGPAARSGKDEDGQLAGRRWLPLPLAVVALLLLAAAVWLTGSLGAILAGCVGLVLLPMGIAPTLIARRRRAVLVVLVAVYLTVVGAVAVYGLTKQTLPHPSLAFRWHYWTTAATAYADEPLTGLGRENFAQAYMRYKPAVSTEEVRNPHNLWLNLLVELGPLGLLGGGVLSLVVLSGALRNLGTAPAAEMDDRLTPLRAVPVAGGVLLVHGLFSGTPFAEPGVALVWVTDIAIKWSAGFGLAAWLLHVVGDRAAGRNWVTAGLLAALSASLVHALLSFALLTPGGLAIFGLCAVAAIGPRCGGREEDRSWRWALGVLGAGAFAVYVWVVLVPMSNTSAALAKLETSARGGRPLAAAEQLVAVSRQDPAAARAAARMLLQMAAHPEAPTGRRLEWLEAAHRYATIAAGRDPLDSGTLALVANVAGELARVHEQQGHDAAADEYLEASARAWSEAVARYPTNPRTRISAGQAWLALWQRTGEPAYADVSREHFERAREIDRQRPPEDVVRLRTEELQAIDAGLQALPPVR